MAWEFKAPKVVTGIGAIAEIGRLSSSLGTKALLVLGAGGSLQKIGIADKTVGLLNQAGITVHIYSGVMPEPDLNNVNRGLNECRLNGCDMVIGLGGGSVIDTAKAVAALTGSPVTLEDAFFGSKAIDTPGLPCIAVPTTAGTGSEATFNSVLTDKASGLKQSIRGQALLPSIALVDPELTLSMPPSLTAQTGMDAFTQAIESYVSKGASPISDALAAEAIGLIGRNLEKAYNDGGSIEPRAAVSYGSLLAGIALANARLGAVHGLAHAIGSRCAIAHGTVCAVLLPYVVRYNWDTVKGKYLRVQEILGIDDLPSYIDNLNASFGIPVKLSSLGLKEELFDIITAESLPSGSMKANPRQVIKGDIYDILHQNL